MYFNFILVLYFSVLYCVVLYFLNNHIGLQVVWNIQSAPSAQGHERWNRFLGKEKKKEGLPERILQRVDADSELEREGRPIEEKAHRRSA